MRPNLTLTLGHLFYFEKTKLSLFPPLLLSPKIELAKENKRKFGKKRRPLLITLTQERKNLIQEKILMENV